MFSLARAACCHSGMGQVGGRDSFQLRTNPTVLPVPTTKPTVHTGAPSSLLLCACSLGFPMHRGHFHPISCAAEALTSLYPSLLEEFHPPSSYSPGRKAWGLLPPLPPAAAALLVNGRNHSSCTSSSCHSALSGALRAECESAVKRLRARSGFYVLSC